MARDVQSSQQNFSSGRVRSRISAYEWIGRSLLLARYIMQLRRLPPSRQISSISNDCHLAYLAILRSFPAHIRRFYGLRNQKIDKSKEQAQHSPAQKSWEPPESPQVASPASELSSQDHEGKLCNYARFMTADPTSRRSNLILIIIELLSHRILAMLSKARYRFFGSSRSFRVFGGVLIPNRSCIEVIVSARASFRMRHKIDASIRFLTTLVNNHQRRGD